MLVLFWSVAILLFAWFGKINHPDIAWEFVKWMVGLYIAGDVGEKWAQRK